MKFSVKSITILIFLLLIPYIILSIEVNFFINYNFVTFLSFDNLINSKSPNFNVYLEYNPLIVTYLNWNKKYLIHNLKNKIDNGLIKIFKIHDTFPITTSSEKWFLNLQKTTDEKIFSSIQQNKNILILSNLNININILNLKELEAILQSISVNKFKNKLNFKIDLSLFLYEKINKLLSVIRRFKNLKFNLFIFSDARYSASNKEINDFVDLIYSIKTEKILNKYEKKIFDLTDILFSLKMFDNIDSLMLNLFPLTSNLIKKHHVASMEYNIHKNKYITLFDKENFFSFDLRTGHLKKWFLYDKGIALINFDSCTEKVYIKGKKNIFPVNLKNIKYYKYSNGLSFKYDSDKSIEIEKNIILQYTKLFLTYKIRNNHKRRQRIIFVIENKFSPSLLDSLVNLKNDFAFYHYKKGFTTKYNNYIHSFINLNTGYGLSWDYYNKPRGVEFFKDFYNYTKKIYYKFSLYPHEQKVITISYRRIYIKEKTRASFMKEPVSLTNQYFGDYGVQ